MHQHACTPVGLLDIAAMFDIKPQSARQWQFRGILPDPRWKVSGLPAWCVTDLVAWAEQTGRTIVRPVGEEVPA